jgi:hypothetical protein
MTENIKIFNKNNMGDEWEKVEASPTWDFKKDKELVGTFVEVETEVGPNVSNLYTFKKADGELIAVWGNTILDMRFKNLELGDKVKIVYHGKAMSPTTKREYHNFEVFKAKGDKVKTEESIEDDPGYQEAFES